MIAFFPEIYPDELLYSQIARYHAHSGYSNLVFTMTDIYKNANLTLPSIEFVNQYTPDAMKWITKNKSWEIITEQHTMHPAYIRFLPKQRKIDAINGVIRCDGNWKKLISDYLEFFGNDIPKMTQSYLQKIFNGYAYDNYFVLQIAYFLKISVYDITHLPNNTSSNEFFEIYQQLSAKHRIDYAIIEDIASTVIKFTNQKNRISQKEYHHDI